MPLLHHKYGIDTTSKQAARVFCSPQGPPPMFLASIISLFTAPKAYVWQPALTMTYPTVVSQLMPDNAR